MNKYTYEFTRILWQNKQPVNHRALQINRIYLFSFLHRVQPGQQNVGLLHKAVV